MTQGHKRVIVSATDCGFDSHSREGEGVRSSVESEEWSVLILGSLCLSCYIGAIA